jgi:hypothetical protein
VQSKHQQRLREIKKYTEEEGELHGRGRWAPAEGALLRREEIAFIKALSNIEISPAPE